MKENVRIITYCDKAVTVRVEERNSAVGVIYVTRAEKIFEHVAGDVSGEFTRTNDYALRAL